MQMNMYRHKVKNVSQLPSSLLKLYLAYTGATEPLFGDQVVNIQKELRTRKYIIRACEQKLLTHPHGVHQRRRI